MACGQSFGCDGRCRLTGICPDYQRLNSVDLNGYAANARNHAFAQDYADASPARVSNYYHKPREMTAADLGLIEVRKLTIAEWNYIQRALAARRSDAPYSFWLGADHG